MRKMLTSIGDYFIMMNRVLSRPEKLSVFINQLNIEFGKIGIGSIGIVLIISLFVGAVVTIQTAINMFNPLLPEYLVGLATRDSVILEFSPTMISVILAGKVGSNIASEIGTMRVTEQIDALEIMGVNSASFLILPKIIASIIFFPFLIILSMSVALVGGWLGGQAVDVSTSSYILGLHHDFMPFYITYALIKTIFFAFIITSVSSFYGYYTKGGALDVGRSSTKAVVYSSIIILICNFILTDLLLS